MILVHNLTIHLSSLEAIDGFLANTSKCLDDYQPHWTYQPGYKDHQISWPILEEDTGFTRSRLQFRIPDQHPEYCSISLFFKGSIVCRLDKDSINVCKANPLFAFKRGLPAKVCGPHIHTWSDNRDHIWSSGIWDIKARRGIGDEIRGIEDMFFWLCDHINVRIQGHNKPLTLPNVGLWGQSC